jgi:hypothetical protein
VRGDFFFRFSSEVAQTIQYLQQVCRLVALRELTGIGLVRRVGFDQQVRQRQPGGSRADMVGK